LLQKSLPKDLLERNVTDVLEDIARDPACRITIALLPKAPEQKCQQRPAREEYPQSAKRYGIQDSKVAGAHGNRERCPTW